MIAPSKLGISYFSNPLPSRFYKYIILHFSLLSSLKYFCRRVRALNRWREHFVVAIRSRCNVPGYIL